MTIVSEIPWDAIGAPAYATHAHPAFREALTTVADRARAMLPDSASRIDTAVALVLAGAVEVLADGTARVASPDNGTTVVHIVNGSCDCRAFPQAPQGWCAHRLAHALCKRATTLAQQTTAHRDVPAPVPPAPRPAPIIPTEFVTTIHGKEFVQYGGLLAMAHAQGLSSLQAELLTVTPELATARATATFADGRTFTEAADATPDNVNAQVRKHFARCALTRAKSRALRDALNIGIVALEELD
jgi:hypothetical protein